MMRRVKVGRPLIDVIKLCYRSQRSVLLMGPHGIGKSEIFKAAANELSVGFIDRDLSLMDPPDLVGLPKLDCAVTRYLPPAFLPTEGEGLLIFEELNRCPSYMRAPCLQLLTARRLNDYTLPAGWLPMAAINPADGGYEVQDLDPALLSRFVLVEAEPDPQEWLVWARDHGIHSAVINYVAADAEIFASPESNPRAWKYVSDILYAAAGAHPETLHAAVAGQVGNKRAAAFLSTVRLQSRPVTVQDVLAAYSRHCQDVQAWTRAGKLDLVRNLLLQVQKHLQAKQNYESVKKNCKQWQNLSNFLKDLPGDLREQAEEFFQERGYEWPLGRRKAHV